MTQEKPIEQYIWDNIKLFFFTILNRESWESLVVKLYAHSPSANRFVDQSFYEVAELLEAANAHNRKRGNL